MGTGLGHGGHASGHAGGRRARDRPTEIFLSPGERSLATSSRQVWFRGRRRPSRGIPQSDRILREGSLLLSKGYKRRSSDTVFWSEIGSVNRWSGYESVRAAPIRQGDHPEFNRTPTAMEPPVARRRTTRPPRQGSQLRCSRYGQPILSRSSGRHRRTQAREIPQLGPPSPCRRAARLASGAERISVAHVGKVVLGTAEGQN